MKLEFIKDSPELDEFVKTLKLYDTITVGGDFDDDHRFDAIYFQESTDKYYKVHMYMWSSSPLSSYTKAVFEEYRRNFKAGEPYVVSFCEVKPVEVVRTEWEEVES